MSREWIDLPEAPRAGEELDLVKLAAFLRERLPGAPASLEVAQFPCGYSNLTYLLRLGQREMVLRRPPLGARIKSAHDVGREFRILSRLQGFYAQAPKPLVYCEDESVLGAPFYVMERVTGVILRAHPPRGLALTSELMRRLSESFIDNLVAIHAVDCGAAGLGELGRPEGYVVRQVEGWVKRYLNARTDDIAEMEELAAWLDRHRPREAGACLIHNDYKYDNLVLDSDDLPHIIATLDWEMSTLGDPLMDLGSALGYWVDADDPPEWRQQAFGVTTLPGNLSREQLVERYAVRSRRTVPDPIFYYAYGLFKIAVIVQQIYARYRQGLMKDDRFARLIEVVRAASRMGRRAIELGRISRLGGAPTGATGTVALPILNCMVTAEGVTCPRTDLRHPRPPTPALHCRNL
jgi:aminoglycoside phosphotransferase (APT) family kinase protein